VPAFAAESLLDLHDGWVDDRLIEDEVLYDVELECIFAEDWTLVAHEGDLTGVGNYVTTYVGEDPLVVVRQADGQIAAFLNSCRHRGFKVCRSAAGSAERFVCGNHGWTYAISGELQLIGDKPADLLVEPGIGLVPLPHVRLHDGWIMVSWSERQPAGSPWMILDNATPIGPPDRVWLPVNWKTAAIRLRSFIGDLADAVHPPNLGGPYLSPATHTIHTLRPSGHSRTELTTWRLIGAGAAADGLVERLASSDLELDAMPASTETMVSLRRGASLAQASTDDHDNGEADACAPPAVPRQVIRRRLDGSIATGVYSAWFERLDTITRQRLGVIGASASGAP
jgi:nitrite reductase/ring-hydroxylating ferredoxin subunit